MGSFPLFGPVSLRRRSNTQSMGALCWPLERKYPLMNLKDEKGPSGLIVGPLESRAASWGLLLTLHFRAGACLRQEAGGDELPSAAVAEAAPE